MNLLPKDHKEFGTEDYWNRFFSKQKSQPFEWYGEYESLSDILDKYIHPKDFILVIGCGNSKMSADLYDVGICNSVSIDISGPVIKQMREKYGKDRPKMRYDVMNVFDLTFENEAFSVVIDKGTLDALLVDGSNEMSEKINKMFSEIERVLRYGGRYLCFSLLQEHILKKLLDWFIASKSWMIRFHRCMKAEAKHDYSLAFPVYAIVFTKMKKIDGIPQILEIIHENSAPKRSSEKDIIEYVKNAQHYAFLKHYLSKKKMLDDDICLELCSSDTGEMKYKMFVVDRKEKSELKFAVFIVPEGRETDWLFSTPEGRQVLAANADTERLIVVHLLRNIVYSSLEEVKNDLSQKVLELAPVDFKSKVPILSLGDDVGKRDIKYKSCSKFSGEYVVEDVVAEDNEMFRRLIFLNSPYLVQSEVKLNASVLRKKNSPPKYLIDLDYLACDHHTAMVVGLNFLKVNMLQAKILIIGLGGGILPTYFHRHFPGCFVDIAELDSAMLDVSKKWFDLTTDERLSVHIKEGTKFISDAATKGSKYDLVILDVDNKDTSEGLTSPPNSFIDPTVLNDLKKITEDHGIVVTNFSCRNQDVRTKVLLKLKSAFKSIFLRKIPAQYNEVLYCSMCGDSEELLATAKENSPMLLSFLSEQIPNSDFDMFKEEMKDSLIEVTAT